jgi:hypothetical protein
MTDATLNGNGDTGSEDDTQIFPFIREDVSPDDPFYSTPIGGTPIGDVVEAEIVGESSPRSRKLTSDRPEPLDRDALGGIPKIDEWMHFFSKVIIRLATDFYIDHAFRDIDEDELSDREIDRIHLDDVERDRMARPFAEYSNKSKFMRKHGRMIIASADSVDSVIQMGMWFSRVNRIAARHRGTRPVRSRRGRKNQAPPMRVHRPQPQPDFEDRSNEDVSAGPGPQPRKDHWRPDIAGQVFNTTGGG